MRLFLTVVATVMLPVSCLLANEASSDKTLSVVSYNIRYASPRDGEDVWPNRKDAVGKFLSDHDVIGLQEATYPQIKNLVKRLPDHDWYGLGRDDGKEGGEAAPIFYRRDRLTVESKGTIWLCETPDEVGKKGWDAALPRTMTWLLLNETATGRKLIVANTHFDHRGSKARHESGKLIRKFLANQHGQYPVVLLGDFNCLADSAPYQAITSGNQPLALKDARTQSKMPASGPESTWSGFKAIAAGRIIDHVFVHGDIDVLNHEVLDPKTESGRFASDHLPVRIRIQFQSPSP
ncbi:endonuclease/exonuclease/phosphatase family protein [Planctomycetes bacterium K23_9]|uniref:Endonuclease/Exonuclease/phosphatase family protein n=1 Tax=Stieleria marina TaxID=1930275 RepID=A0A517P1N2_9BACT|nr:Endonuclease/Exonuclease/phosphatase family protein [Planctomycetes bacterium K23_9]